MDIFMLVEEQGAHIEHIQTNVERTQDYVAASNEKFKLAARYKKKNPLRQLCCCCCPPWRCCLQHICAFISIHHQAFPNGALKVSFTCLELATLQPSTIKAKAMVLQFFERSSGGDRFSGAQKTIRGKGQNWYLRHLFLSRGREATTIGGDSSVSATHQHCCLLETFTVI